MKKIRYLWNLLKIFWKFFNVKALAVFFFKVFNFIRYFRRGIAFIIAVIHLMYFYTTFGTFEAFGLYWLLLDVLGPQFDKYKDYNDNDEDAEALQSVDYLLPNEED